MLDVCLLGTGGTMPSPSRHLASCLLRYNGSTALIDCGEATQIALKKSGYTFKPIDVICITHFHADHVSGLPGMLLSMGNEGREDPILITGPVGLERVVNSLRIIAPELPFKIYLRELREKEEIIAMDGYDITAFRVNHAVPCYAYVLTIKRAGLFDVEKAKANNVPLKVWSRLQKNKEAEFEGVLYKQEMVLGKDRKGLKVCYCTDTKSINRIIDYAKDSDLFICEGMYPSDEKIDKANETKHMTFEQAARLALAAEPKRFWLTHFSPSLPDPENYINTAKSIYPATVCGKDGMHIDLMFED